MRIRYRRPPDREEVFHQTLVHEGDDGLVTLMPAAGIREAMTVSGRVVLEPGAPVVWFTFPGAHHDIGRFHTADDRFTGYYANILTPVERSVEPEPDAPDETPVDTWRTTDLFLDVFLDRAGAVHVLDRDELAEALARGWIDEPAARSAEREADRLVAAAAARTWPPDVVDRWPLARARAVAARAGP